jgi:pre-mRNA 3'-end-processing factor FIP1
LRFGLKRGKLLYLFKYPDHDVEREKHRNVITRARFIKASLENAGYTLIPWDFKKAQPPTFWEGEQGEQQEEGGQQRVHPDRQTDDRTMEEEDDDLYGPPETVGTENQPVKKEEQAEDGDTDGDQPMDEGLESGEEEDESSDESVWRAIL